MEQELAYSFHLGSDKNKSILYLDEFEQSRIEYNHKQTREDRKYTLMKFLLICIL